MGIVVGGTFEDYGNTIEYTVSAVTAYERLSGDRVRLYVTEERGDRRVLQYTLVAPMTAFAAFGRLCFEIAGQKHVLPDWALEPLMLTSAH
jgi:hypothetical protein